MKKSERKRSGSTKGRKKGRLSSTAGASIAIALTKKLDEIAEKPLAEICRRLWHALPTVAQALVERQELLEAEGEPTPQSRLQVGNNESTDDSAAAAAVDPIDQLSVPWVEMESAVTCLFMATHSNVTSEDAAAAVAAVVGTAEVPAQPMYTQADVFAFLDTVPSRWLAHYELLKPDLRGTHSANRALRLLVNELIDCVTRDEAPCTLLPPSEVLMLSNHHTTNPVLPKAGSLRTPVGDFVPLVQQRRYPPVFGRLWSLAVASAAEEESDELSLAAFSTVVVWMNALHFCNATETRSRAAAAPVFYECLNERHTLCRASFRRACQLLCRRYGQRRDTAAYLEELLRVTASTVGVTGDVMSLSLTHADLAVVDTWRRRVTPSDPEQQLYLSDELRLEFHEQDLMSAGPTVNRIAVYGDRAVGKTTVGKALASFLHSVHLDVLELAVKAVLAASHGATENNDGNNNFLPVSASSSSPISETDAQLNQQVLACVEALEAIPLALQAALIRRELDSATCSTFRGFVFSDTIAMHSGGAGDDDDDGAARAALQEFLQAAGLVDVAVPAVFLELTRQNSALQGELAAAVEAAEAAAYAVVKSSVDAETERVRCELEVAETRASCLEIIENYAQLQKPASPADEDASAEALEEAQQQAAEAEDLLAQLDAEREAAEEEAAARLQQSQQDAENDTESTAEAKEAQERARLETILRHLIQEGRAALLNGAQSSSTTTADASTAEVLASAVPCWAACVTTADALHRVLSVSAASPVDEVVTYVTRALQLWPTVLPFNPALVELGGEEPAVAPQYKEAARNGDEEECGRLAEAAAAEQGFGLSDTWKRFCPVTYEEDGVLVDGAACFMCVYRNCQYFFVSRARLDAFVANPLAYLQTKQAIADKQRVLLIAGESLKARLVSPEAVLESTLVADMVNALQLTPLSLQQYAQYVGGYCDLRNRRSAVLAARREFEKTEWEQRDERLEKRLKAEAKKRKPTHPTKPKVKKRSSAANAANNTSAESGPKVSLVEPSVSAADAEGSAAAKPVEIVLTPTERELQRRIAAAKERLQDTMPVLVVMAAWDETAIEPFDMLLQERCLPECVIVLEDNSSATAVVLEDNSSATAVTGDADAANDATSAAPSEEAVATLLGKIEKAESAAPGTGAAAAWKRKDGDNALPPQTFTTHMVQYAIAGEAAAAAAVASAGLKMSGLVPRLPEEAAQLCALREVLQLVCPAALVVADGTVDEDLGLYDEDDEEEEESELDEYGDGEDGGDGEEGPDGNRAGVAELGAVLPPTKPDPRLKPRRRYLHQFGSRLEYCPVTLQECRLLVRGRTELSLTFGKRLYCFASEECKEKFAADPMRYTTSLPPRDVPPRLWVIGARLSGKRTLAAGLQREYGAHHFYYSREFFERCIEAAQQPEGGVVEGIFIPYHGTEHKFVLEAAALLKEVRDFAADQDKNLKLRSEAEVTMDERERKEEERAERAANGNYSESEDYEDEEDSETAAANEAKETALQEQLEFEPEDPEDAQERLTTAYLCMAACVTRFEPFETDGYIMVSPPFSDADLDILFEQNCIPEAVLHLELRPDVYEERHAAYTRAHQLAKTAEMERNGGDGALGTEEDKLLASRRTNAEARRRERALQRWRRRHIGADDPDVVPSSDGEDDDDDNGGRKRVGHDAAEDDADATLVDPESARADELEAVAEFLEIVEDRRVPIFKPNADVEKASVLRATCTALTRHLRDRLSFFYSVEVVEYDKAVVMLKEGRLDLSSYGYTDCVELRAEREGKRRECVWKQIPDGETTTAFVGEPVVDRRKPTWHKKRKTGNGAEVDENETEEEDNNSTATTTGRQYNAAALATGMTATGTEEEEEEEEMSEVDPDELDEFKEHLERRRRREWKKKAPRCGVLCGRLYFFQDDASLSKFVANPLDYAEAPPPLPPVAHHRKPVLALYADDAFYHPGDNHSSRDSKGTSGDNNANGGSALPATVSLAEAVADNLGATLITESKLLAWAAERPDLTGPLAARALAAALSGGAGDSLVAELLVARLSSAAVRRSGAVLLNLPRTALQVDAITAAGPSCPQISATAKVESPCNVSVIPFADDMRRLIAGQTLIAPTVAVPFCAQPRDPANLAEVVRSVHAMYQSERSAVLRRALAFPVDLQQTRQPTALVEGHLSPYRWYCPYQWVEEQDLVFIDPAALTHSAEYLGEFYVFSTAEYLQRFLRDPQEVADADTTLRPLPEYLPRPVVSLDEEPAGACLALKGCCPVLMYDTRENRGLRGVIEPVAKVGSYDCIVEYAGQYYACLDDVNKERFLRRPWQYVGGAALPAARKCPLTDRAIAAEEEEAAKAITDEDFMRRCLYDAVAHAMMAVADARPRYPGLSDEESAIKFMSLHMKAHHEQNDEIRQRQYSENFELFKKRSMLYKTTVEDVSPAAAADDEKAAEVDGLFADYEVMQNGVKIVSELGHLRRY